MTTVNVSFSEFFRAVRRNSKNTLIVNKNSTFCGVQYWFYTQKTVWNYTIIDPIEESIIDNRLKSMVNIDFRVIGEVR